MNFCYLCGNELIPSNDHGEHIFQQGIGGTLAPHGILCKTCGKNLGSKIDVNFNKLFDIFTSRLPINFDRKSDNSVFSPICSIYSEEFERNFEIQLNKKDRLPIKPDAFIYKGKLVVIYPKQNKEKGLAGYKLKQMKDFGFTDENTVKIIRDFNFVKNAEIQIPFHLPDKDYRQGIAKIATGFATYHGVKRELLNCVLDTKNNAFLDKIQLIPYFPSDFISQALEELRFDIYNLEYISHQIKLFNIENDLICYVELFGTFQCHILLSDNYNGKAIYKSYMQPLFKMKRSELSGLPGPKNLMLYKHYLPVNQELDFSDKTLNDINTGIRKQPNKQDLDEYYEILLGCLSKQVTLFNSKKYDLKVYENLLNFLYLKKDYLDNNLMDISLKFYHFLTNPCCFKTNPTPIVYFTENKNKLINYNVKKLNFLNEFIEKIHNGEETKYSIYLTDF